MIFNYDVSTIKDLSNVTTLASGDDLDNYYKKSQSGVYYIQTGVLNIPDSAATYGVLISVGTSESENSSCDQIYICYWGMWWRNRSGNPVSWKAWHHVNEITSSTAIAIPAAGSSVSKDLPGITSSHQLTRWNFSSSPENAPPATLTWTTYDGYFTITNSGGTTSETITPVFERPISRPISNHS